MNVEAISGLIQAVGFPIVLVGAMGYFIWQLWKQSAERENKLMEFNEKAMNTLNKYADRLTVIEEDVKTIKDDINTLAQGGK
jgi:hypothetical protein